jgi:hypothetical protein
MIVNPNAAQLFLPNEHRIPVSRNHLDMVKFALKVDEPYQTVVTHMGGCVNKIDKRHPPVKIYTIGIVYILVLFLFLD